MATAQTTQSKKAAAKTAAKPQAKKQAAAPAAKAQVKQTAAKAQAKQTAAKATPVRKAPTASARKTAVSPQERHRMIEMAAYLCAESDGFCGSDLDYWLQAEAEIDGLLDRASFSMQ